MKKIYQPVKRSKPVYFFENLTMKGNKKGCWLWTGPQQGQASPCSPNNKTYGCIYHDKERQAAHRYAYEFFYGPIPEGKFICHRCDVPLCVNPDHLFLGDHEQNMEDMNRKGRGRGKFTVEQVIAIRKDYCETECNLVTLAEKWGASRDAIRRIVRSTYFKWLPPIACEYRETENLAANRTRRFKPDQVREMRKLHDEEHLNAREIAERFECSIPTAQSIIKRRTYTYI